jgi:hypothetical protein
MAAETSSDGDGDSQNSNPTPGQHDRWETLEECPGSSRSSVMKHNFREIDFHQELIDGVTDGALQKRKEIMAYSKGVEKETIEYIGRGREDDVVLNGHQMGGTIMEKNKLAELPSNDVTFKVQDMGHDLLKGHGGGPPTQYVGNWDTKLG